MKKTIIMAIALAAAMTSCNLLDDDFDWSNDKEEKEFTSDEWNVVQRNVFKVESHERGTETVTFPESGDLLVVTDYHTGTASLLFKSFVVVDPLKEFEDWSREKGMTWIRQAYELVLIAEKVPFRVSEGGKIQFGKKTVNGVLTFGDMEGDEVFFYNKTKGCKVSISGEMIQEGIQDTIKEGVAMKGNYNIKIITPDGERLLLGYDELKNVYYTDDVFLDWYR